MEWLERTIAAISPGTALRREAQRQLLQNWRVARPNTYRERARNLGGGNTLTQAYGVKLRDIARHLQRNDPTISAAIREVALRSSHFKLQPMVRTRSGELLEDFNLELLDLWEGFKDSAESMGVMGWAQMRQVIGETWIRDGEQFTQHLLNSATYPYPTDLPLALFAMEGDYVPHDLYVDTPRTVQGVVIGTGNRAIRYHVHMAHPNEFTAGIRESRLDTMTINAENMSALRRVERLGQVRGISGIAVSAEAAQDVNEYLQSERISMKFAASVGLQINRPADNATPQIDTNGYNTVDIAPGFVLDNLPPGAKAEMMSISRPGDQFGTYLKWSNRIIAAGIGANYSAISNDFEGSYSSQRQMLVTAQAYYEVLQQQQISQLDRPVWRRFLQALTLAGKMPTGMRRADPETITDCEFVGPPMPWIDPAKEATAHEIEVRAKFESRAGIIRRRGRDIRQVDREIEADEQAIEPGDQIGEGGGGPGSQEPNQGGGQQAGAN